MFALLLGFAKRINQTANRFLALALITIVLQMVWVLGIDVRLGTYFPHWSWLPIQFLLVLGPIIFFYVLKITLPEYKFRFKDLLHFSPLLLQQGALVLEVKESIEKGVATYGTFIFRQLNPVLQLLVFISVSIYLYASHRLIERFYQRLKFNEGGDRYRCELRWLHRLLTSFGILWLLWIPYTGVDYFYYHGRLGIQIYESWYLLLSAFFIWIAAAAHLRPDVGAPLRIPFVSRPLPPAELKRKGLWLKEVMKANLYYHDAELSLRSLAEALDLYPNELSRIINTAFRKNFNDFINEYRIREVTRKMRDPAYDKLTLLGIALTAGFNSKSTFNRVFREMTGKPPAEYMSDLKKERPTYTLRPYLEPYSHPTAVILCHGTTLTDLKRATMVKNYIKTAFRNLLKNKGFTAINVLGLALGLATCLLIVFYVFDELSYDRYNEKADRIYRVNIDFRFGGAENLWAVSAAPLAPALKADFPEIEQVARLCSQGGAKVRKGTGNIQENKMVYADPALFDVFTLPMINGDPKTALKEPHTVVITESTAKKYFDTDNAVGKVFTFNDTALYKVTGVIKDVREQSHFNFDFFISMSTLQDSKENAWFSGSFNTYILLRPGVDPQKLQAKLPAFLEKHSGPDIQSILHLSFAQMEQGGNIYRLKLFPLLKIHLQSNALGELDANGNLQTVYIFAVIAVLILLIACVNFMNLSTARSSNRAKEVGVRKVLGSTRKNLIAQFLTESIIVTLIGAIIAVFAAWALLPLFNGLSGKQLLITPQIIGWLFPVMIVFIIVVGCLAGSYPAIYLSSFQPIEVLKGKLAAGFKGGLLRNVLVVGQFIISIGLIIGTLVMYHQLEYIQHKDVGYNREHVLIVWDTGTLPGNKAKAFKHEVQQLAGIQNVAMSDYLPTSDISSSMSLYKSPVIDQKQATASQLWDVDEDYIPALGIKMAAGRNFSKQMATDSTAIIVNETAAKRIGFDNPLNQMMYAPQDKMAKVMKPFHIIGVMKDFNFKSLRENVTPLILFNTGGGVNAMAIRVRSTDVSAIVEQVKAKWTELSPNQQFNYNFMDDEFDKLYRSEQHTGEIAASFTSLAIIIACLGLFGLSAYAAEQRTKEIGIRKVLGANVSTIVGMLSKDFILLVLIAIVVAVPAAWYFMHQWLEGFAYHQNIQWWLVIAASLGAIAIAFITISFQSIKAALANPVKSLRSE